MPDANSRASITLVVKDGEYRLYVLSDPKRKLHLRLFTADLKLDPASKSFELTVKDGDKKGQKRHGIYEHKNGQLKLCYGPARSPVRPSSKPRREASTSWKRGRRTRKPRSNRIEVGIHAAAGPTWAGRSVFGDLRSSRTLYNYRMFRSPPNPSPGSAVLPSCLPPSRRRSWTLTRSSCWSSTRSANCSPATPPPRSARTWPARSSRPPTPSRSAPSWRSSPRWSTALRLRPVAAVRRAARRPAARPPGRHRRHAHRRATPRSRRHAHLHRGDLPLPDAARRAAHRPHRPARRRSRTWASSARPSAAASTAAATSSTWPAATSPPSARSSFDLDEKVKAEIKPAPPRPGAPARSSATPTPPSTATTTSCPSRSTTGTRSPASSTASAAPARRSSSSRPASPT